MKPSYCLLVGLGVSVALSGGCLLPDVHVDEAQQSRAVSQPGGDEDAGTTTRRGDAGDLRPEAGSEAKPSRAGGAGASPSGGAAGASGMRGSVAAGREGSPAAGSGGSLPAAGAGPMTAVSATAPDSRKFQPASRLDLGTTQISDLQLARSGKNSWLIAWEQSRDADVRAYARRFEPSRGWGEAMPLADAGTSFVALAADASDRAIVLLASTVSISAAVSVTGLLCPPLSARVFSGGAWAPARSLGCGRLGSAVIASNDAGQTVVVWTELLAESGRSGWTQHLARFDPSSGWSDVFDLQSIAASSSDSQAARDNALRWPFGDAAAVGPAGDAILVHSWVSQDSVTARGLGRTGAGGSTRQLESASPPPSSDTMTRKLITPRVAIDGVGRALVVWTHSDGTRFNVRANRTVDGTNWNTTTSIETNDSGDAQDVELAMDAQGNAIAIWLQSDGLTNALWFNRFEIDRGWGTAARVEPANPSSNPSAPAIAFDDAGHALAAWVDARRIRASRYTKGAGWTPATDVSSGSAEYGSPQVSLAKDGSGLILWPEPINDTERNYGYARLE